MISENDKKKSTQQVVARLQEMYPATMSIEATSHLESMVIGLINDFPPGEPDKPGHPCEHGFDDSFWCAECNKVTP